MLIVLISQHSTIGLPVDTDSTTLANDKHHKEKGAPCKEGFELVDDICEPIATTTAKDAGTPSDSTVTVTRTQEIAVTDPTRNTGGCPEGQKHGKHGICEDVKTSETTTINAETTSDGMNYMDCPGGLKRGDDGFCPEINPINRTASVNPKGLLKPDGSCPDNYVKINEKCLYIKPKSNESLTGGDLNPTTSSTNDVNSSDIVHVESGNVCPQGTEYFTNGLCRKRPASPKGDFDANGNRICPANYNSIDGKCIPKDVKDDSTPTSVQESTTRLEESDGHHETTESLADNSNDGRHDTTLPPKSLRQ